MIAAIRSARYRKLIQNTFRADHAVDAALFVQGLTEDVVFQLGGMPPIIGRDAVQAMLSEMFAQFRQVDHTLQAAHELKDLLIYRAQVVYTWTPLKTPRIPWRFMIPFGDETGWVF